MNTVPRCPPNRSLAGIDQGVSDKKMPASRDYSQRQGRLRWDDDVSSSDGSSTGAKRGGIPKFHKKSVDVQVVAKDGGISNGSSSDLQCVMDRSDLTTCAETKSLSDSSTSFLQVNLLDGSSKALMNASARSDLDLASASASVKSNKSRFLSDASGHSTRSKDKPLRPPHRRREVSPRRGRGPSPPRLSVFPRGDRERSPMRGGGRVGGGMEDNRSRGYDERFCGRYQDDYNREGYRDRAGYPREYYEPPPPRDGGYGRRFDDCRHDPRYDMYAREERHDPRHDERYSPRYGRGGLVNDRRYASDDRYHPVYDEDSRCYNRYNQASGLNGSGSVVSIGPRTGDLARNPEGARGCPGPLYEVQDRSKANRNQGSGHSLYGYKDDGLYEYTRQPGAFQESGNGRQKEESPSGAPLYIEVFPGVTEKLRRTQETMAAIARDFYSPATCIACNMDVFCISDVKYFICPECKCVSLFSNEGKGAQYQRSDVGIAFGFETLFKVQSDMAREKM